MGGKGKTWIYRLFWLFAVVVGSVLFIRTVAVRAASITDPQEYTQNGPFWADLKSVGFNISGGNFILELCYYADFPNGGPRYLNGVFYLDTDRNASTGSTPATVTFDRPGTSTTTVSEPDEWAGNGRSEGSEYRLVWSLQTQTSGSGTLPNASTPNSGLWQWSGGTWVQLSTTVSYQFVDSDGSGKADCLRFTFPESAVGSPSSPAGLVWSVPQMWDLQWLVQSTVVLKGSGSGDAITVDGEDDWSGVSPIATFTDASGDGNPAEIDLTEMKVTNDDNFLYVYIRVNGAGTTNTAAPGRRGYNQEEKWFRSQWLVLDMNNDGDYIDDVDRQVYASWELNGNQEIIFTVLVYTGTGASVDQYSFFGSYTDTTYDAAVAPGDVGDGSACTSSDPCGAARLDTTTTLADEGILEFRIPLTDLGLNPGDTIANLAVGDTFGEYQDYFPAEAGKTVYLTPSEDTGKVVINEVLYRQTCSNGTDNDEFVELYVTQDINMCGWTVADGNVVGGDTEGIGSFSYTFNPTDGCQFHAGDYIVIWVGNDNPMTQAPHAALQVHLGKSVKLNNDGDDIWLFDADGEIVDYMAYGSDNAINDQSVLPAGFWVTNAPTVSASGQSLSLTPNGQDTNSGGDWEPTTSDSAPGPVTRDTDALSCGGNDRVSSAGVNNNGLDYGDAPAAYGAAGHSPDAHLYLGTTQADPEGNPLYSAFADGDDTDATDDEDGVSTFPPLDTSATSYTLNVQVHNAVGVDAYLVGWIDFDGNGAFDTDEFAFTTVSSGTTGTVSLTWSSIPADITAGDTFVRLRLSREPLAASDAATVDGIGEVEDYPITIASPTPTPTPTNTPTPTPTNTPTPTPTNTPTSTNTPTPTPTNTPTPTPTNTPTPTPTPTRPPLDPPTGEKVGTVNGWPVIRWRQVWINPNTMPMAVRIVDPIPDGTVYHGNLSCEARGTSVTTRCEYDPVQNAVIWEGTLGPDFGHTTEEEAENEVVIVFEVRVTDPDQDTFVNISEANWDENNNGVVDPTDPNVATDSPIEQRARVERPELPGTGFAPGRVTVLPPMPRDMAYQSLGLVWLEIPRLGVQAPIVGVPQREGIWPVDWLWDQIGWLEGTAFPGWPGNTVLTGHVILPSGLPGPFVGLQRLHSGDWIVLNVFGERRIYQVIWARKVRADALWVLGHTEQDVLTLVTCTGWNETRGRYEYRWVVRAVPVR